MLPLVSGINSRLTSVNHALISPILHHQFFEWHFLHQFHRLTTFTIHHPFTLSLQA